jgi:hypothetical protein
MFKSNKTIKKQQNTFGKILDDLTTLEINTIIKKGMSATEPPERVEETVKGLLDRYKKRIDLIFYENSEFSIPENVCIDDDLSIEAFHNDLIKIKKMLDKEGKHGNRLDETDYIRIQRMLAFCDFIWARSDQTDDDIKIQSTDSKTPLLPDPKLYPDKGTTPLPLVTLYNVSLNDISKLKIDICMRDRVKINRYYDLGDERVVMQTRFGIDGDVVTRIEESFSNKPKKLVIEIHDEQTNLSVSYWKSLIDIAKGIIVRD